MNIFAIRIVILLTGIYMFGTLILMGLTVNAYSNKI